VYEARFKQFGLQGSMLSILFIIGKRKDINQKSIADLLVLDQSTLSRDLKKLVNKGWIKISKADDERHSVLEITKSGYKLLNQVAPIWHQLQLSVETILGSSNIEQIDIITNTLKANIEKLKP